MLIGCISICSRYDNFTNSKLIVKLRLVFCHQPAQVPPVSTRPRAMTDTTQHNTPVNVRTDIPARTVMKWKVLT